MVGGLLALVLYGAAVRGGSVGGAVKKPFARPSLANNIFVVHACASMRV